MIPDKFPSHPAPYTKGILEGVVERGWFDGCDVIIDPFAGSGKARDLEQFVPGLKVICSDIEPSYCKAFDLIQADATDLPFESGSFNGAITSVVYCDIRFSDYNRPKAPDNWKGRRGYDLSGKFLSQDETYTLQDRNTASFVKASGTLPGYWELHEDAYDELHRVLKPGSPFAFNYVVRNGDKSALMQHAWMLEQTGFVIEDNFGVPTSGYGFGSNLKKTSLEMVVLFRRTKTAMELWQEGEEFAVSIQTCKHCLNDLDSDVEGFEGYGPVGGSCRSCWIRLVGEAFERGEEDAA